MGKIEIPIMVHFMDNSQTFFFCLSALQPYISTAVTWNKWTSESFNSNFNKYHGRLFYFLKINDSRSIGCKCWEIKI
jgi:hypothetical protein